MKSLFVLLLLFMIATSSLSQETDTRTVEQIITDIYEQYAAESEDDIPDAEVFYDELLQLASHPLSINLANREELERLPFLTPVQVENILYHRYTYGFFTSLYELQLVEGLDMTDIRRMLPFIKYGDAVTPKEEIYWWEIRRYGRHELYQRTDFTVEAKKGYLPGETAGSTAPYSDDRIYSSLKYRFDFRDRIRISFTAEKDAGEPWWTGSGIGFLSGSLQVRSSADSYNVVAGDYTAGFGQGLVLRQGFRRGKSALATQVINTTSGFKRYASTNEHQFFRGVAASLKKSDFTLHAFASHRSIDAIIDDAGIFRSIYTTGLHRTLSEQEKNDRIGQSTGGINITYSRPLYEFGFTGVYTRFSQALVPETKPYNRFYFSGIQQFSSGIHYRFRWQLFNFFGETALSGSNEPATLNGLLFSPASRVTLALVHRYYPYRFNSLFASSFAAQSRVGNEQGMYLGIELLPLARWKLTAYADSYRFDWLRYGVDAPSYGNDFLLQLQHTASRKLNVTLRYRYRQAFGSYRDTAQPVVQINSESKWAGRFQLDYATGLLEFRNTIELNRFNGKGTPTTGYATWQDVGARLARLPLKFSLRYLVFDAPANDNRIYTYEADVLHAFSSPSFSGKGNRMYLVAQYMLSPRTSFWIKASQVRYADGRMQIGSGNEQIEGTKRTEFHFLLRFKP